jgi:hypothetical protein
MAVARACRFVDQRSFVVTERNDASVDSLPMTVIVRFWSTALHG